MTEVEKRLLLLLSELREPEQQNLLAFAEFLASRSLGQVPTSDGLIPMLAQAVAKKPEQPEPPQQQPRPEQESVVAAIKRLRLTYPMLDRRLLLNDTSNAMAKHAISGVSAEIVIDELEEVFEQHYQRYCERIHKASEA